MEPKDIINLTLSTLALLIAFGTTMYTAIRGNYEQKRTILGQLNDVLNDMSSIRVDQAKLYHEYSKDQLPFQNYLSAELNQRYATLLDQAMYLANQGLVRDLVTAPVLNTIAVANASVGRFLLANEYYLKAIKATKDDFYYKALATRSYAQFLFIQQQNFEEGREQFTNSIKLLKGSDNLVRAGKGYVYLIWASLERDVANSQKRAAELFESSRKEYNGIDIDLIRQQNLDYLSSVENSDIKPYAQSSQNIQPLQSVPNPSTISRPL